MSYKDSIIEKIKIYLHRNKDNIKYNNKSYVISLDNDCYLEIKKNHIKYITDRISDCIELNIAEIEIFKDILGG